MNEVDQAESLFRSGCACSQAVLGTYGPRLGLSETEALRVSAGFAGGMRMAETCGAVTGAIMVLVRIPEHRDRRFRPNVIRDSGIPIADSGDSDR
jgi:C_GCAxxG_C_C family probable redox protein